MSALSHSLHLCVNGSRAPSAYAMKPINLKVDYDMIFTAIHRRLKEETDLCHNRRTVRHKRPVVRPVVPVFHIMVWSFR